MAVPMLEQRDVFVAGTGGYHTYRIPATVVTKTGKLLVFCEGRKTGPSDHGDIDLVLKRSLDNGKTWQKMQIVREEGGTAMVSFGMPCPVVDRATGTIWLTFCRNNDRVFVTKSTDDGATWSKPVDISADATAPAWHWVGTGPGHGIQLRSGRLVIPCWADATKRLGEIQFSYVFYSDDHGATWTRGNPLDRNASDECEVVESVDGNLHMNMRSRQGRMKRAVAMSKDGGRTWSPVTYDPSLPEPSCQASVVRLTDTKRHDKNRVLFSNPASEKRVRMTVRISYDECETWSEGKLLHKGPSAYSDLCVLPDMTICCLYERGDKHAYERITLARFNVEWLTDGADRPASRGAPSHKDIGTMPNVRKHLLLDSRIIDRTDGVRLAIGKVTKDPRNPLFKEDKPWEPRFDNLYANVIHDEQDGIYKCWYSPFIIDERTTSVPRDKRAGANYIKVKPNHREMGVCYATSKDGLTWTKPELGIVEFNGSKKNNIVYRGPHGAGVMKDPRDPDPARRYKMFGKSGEPGEMSAAFSKDGLHWSKMTPCSGIKAAGDTHNNAFWAPELGKYVGITRLWDRRAGRIVGRCESADFLEWTQAVEVLRGLSSEAHRQTYAMPVFRYASVYLGLVMLIDTKTDLVDCELTWSPDTVHWERVCPGTPLIPRGPEGSYDWGCVYAAAYPIVLDDEIRLYYGGNNGRHTTWRDGFFCLARLRPDGFACMTPTEPGKAGTLVTKPIRCTGKQLRVSADAAGGSLRVAVMDADEFGLDDAKPITADVTDGAVTWTSGRDLSGFVGKSIRLRFELISARLYAFSFTDK